MLTNWSLSGPDDNGHIWIDYDGPDGKSGGLNLGPADEACEKMTAFLAQLDFGEAQ